MVETTKNKLTRDYKDLKYQEGFGNHCSSEALEGALPVGQNNPQKCPYGLYAEQISGTAFTVPRVHNQRTWWYRIQPSVLHKQFSKASSDEKYRYIMNDFSYSNKNLNLTPNQLRWQPPVDPTKDTDFIDGLITIAGAGDPGMKNGLAIYAYACNVSMINRSFYNSDGDMLIVPQSGTLYITTEMGKMTVEQLEICVIPRGVKFSVEITELSKGWVCEIFKGHFAIPDLGPIGANGLANPRDFKVPVAYYERVKENYVIINKYLGTIYESDIEHSPYNIVAWHGNYTPYKYHLSNYNTMNTVSFDHPDPSIFTVLTAQTDEPGVATCDFVIFPPRWMVGEHTFRPPYFHRNLMSEYMGVIKGAYDAKEKAFSVGCSSLHLPMTAHGPEADVFEKV